MAPAPARARIDEVLDVIGLADRARRPGQDVLRRHEAPAEHRHRPAASSRLLILDEPTVGVDPQSRNAILESVERLSAEGMAVLYTTHYMEEAERLCDRIGIVDLGELKAEGTRAELVALVGEHDRVIIEAAGSLEPAVRSVSSLPGVLTAGASDGSLALIVDNARTLLPELLRAAAASGVSVRGVDVDEPDLEAVFLHLTGRALRD